MINMVMMRRKEKAEVGNPSEGVECSFQFRGWQGAVRKQLIQFL